MTARENEGTFPSAMDSRTPRTRDRPLRRRGRHETHAISRGLIFLYLSGTARTLAETTLFAYLPIALYQQTGEQGLVVISLITAVPAVVRFIAAQLWGAAIDRAGRQKPFTLIGLFGLAALLALLTGVDTPGAAAGLVAFGASVYAAFSPAARTFATLEDERRDAVQPRGPRILPAYLKWESLGWFIGGIGSGLLLDLPGFTMRHLLIVTGAAAFGMALLNAAFFREATSKRDARAESAAGPRDASPRTIASSLLSLYRRREFAGLLGILFFTFFARESFFTTYGIYLTEFLGAPTSVYGGTIALATILGMALYDTASRLAERWGSVTLLRWTATVYSLGYAVTVAFPHPWVVAGYFSLPLFPFLTMASTVAVARMSAQDERGSGLGILEATDLLAIASGSVSAGLIASRYGVPAVPVVSFVVSASGLVVMVGLRSLLERARQRRAKRST